MSGYRRYLLIATHVFTRQCAADISIYMVALNSCCTEDCCAHTMRAVWNARSDEKALTGILAVQVSSGHEWSYEAPSFPCFSKRDARSLLSVIVIVCKLFRSLARFPLRSSVASSLLTKAVITTEMLALCSRIPLSYTRSAVILSNRVQSTFARRWRPGSPL